MLDLRNIDCMELMKEYPDKYFDLAICDPPYSELCNLRGGSSSDAKNGWGIKWANNKHHEWNKKPTDEYFKELFRVSKNQIIWGGNYFINNLYDTPCMVIWDKGQRDFSLADAEIAWCSFNKPVRVFSYSRAANNKQDRFHPTQKPIKLYQWLLKNYAEKGMKILDTHLGSGSIAIACHYAEMDLTGSEIDTEYFNAMIKRVKEQTAQKTLF